MSQFIAQINPQLSPAASSQYAYQTLAAAQEAHIDPCLLIAIVSVESHWKATAISPHGAIGLGQLKPTTAQGMHLDPYIPYQNLRATSQYLRQMLKRFSGQANDQAAIAAYNAGPGAVSRNHNQSPTAMTTMYVNRVVQVWQQSRTRLGLIAPTLLSERKIISAVLLKIASPADADATYWGLSQSANDGTAIIATRP